MTFAGALLRSPRKLLQAAALRMKLRKTRLLFSCWPEKISGNTATLRRGDRAFQERCDYLAVGYGFRPNVELAAALGCAVENACVAVNRLQQTSVPDIYAAGECTGIAGVELASIEGQIAGLAACGQLQAAGTFRRRHASAWQFAGALNEAFRLRPELREVPDGDTIVCRCEDVRWGALQEMRSRREAKLYTRCGMGPCQARICGPILDFMQSADCDTTRPPVFPARLETFVMDEETQEA